MKCCRISCNRQWTSFEEEDDAAPDPKVDIVALQTANVALQVLVVGMGKESMVQACISQGLLGRTEYLLLIMSFLNSRRRHR